MHDLDINFVGAKPIEQSICSHHALQCLIEKKDILPKKKKIEKKDMQLVRNSSGKSTSIYSFCVASVMGLNFFTFFVKCWKAVTQNGSENKVLSG